MKENEINGSPRPNEKHRIPRTSVSWPEGPPPTPGGLTCESGNGTMVEGVGSAGQGKSEAARQPRGVNLGPSSSKGTIGILPGEGAMVAASEAANVTPGATEEGAIVGKAARPIPKSQSGSLAPGDPKGTHVDGEELATVVAQKSNKRRRLPQE